MPSKNYSYKSVHGRSALIVNKTPQMLQEVNRIDGKVLLGSLEDQVASGNGNGSWKGKCPFCRDHKSIKRSNDKSHLPAYLIPGQQEGYVFHCCSCDTTLTTYKFLYQSKGPDVAEQYAQARWDAGELCGGGWNCPLPQKVRERLLSEKEQRREEYRRAEEEIKALNYQKKYGSSPH
jgi:hypothetical protein